jgi:hypothetical protein
VKRGTKSFVFQGVFSTCSFAIKGGKPWRSFMCIRVCDSRTHHQSADVSFSSLGVREEASYSCSYCTQQLFMLDGSFDVGICQTIGCPGHSKRSCIEFPTMRHVQCGSAEIIRAGGSERLCNGCRGMFKLPSLPDKLLKWIPTPSSPEFLEPV